MIQSWGLQMNWNWSTGFPTFLDSYLWFPTLCSKRWHKFEILNSSWIWIELHIFCNCHCNFVDPGCNNWNKHRTINLLMSPLSPPPWPGRCAACRWWDCPCVAWSTAGRCRCGPAWCAAPVWPCCAGLYCSLQHGTPTSHRGKSIKVLSTASYKRLALSGAYSLLASYTGTQQ